MIKPTALWNLAHECGPEDAENLGKILLLCAGKEVELDHAWKLHASVVLKDAADMDERIEELKTKERDRKRRLRLSHGTPRDTTGHHGTPRDTAGQGWTTRDTEMSHGQNGVPRCPAPSVPPSVRSSVPPYIGIDNRCFDETRAREDREVMTAAKAFIAEVHQDPANAANLFDCEDFDAVAIACALTGDFQSVGLWKSYVRDLGQKAVRDEAYQLWTEISQGENVNNRGSALNARLRKIKEASNGQ